MLLLNKEKIVIFTPNKCASTSVNETLIDKLGAQLILGPQGPWRQCGFDYDDVIGEHSMFIPHWCRNWKKILLVREPYDRFVSLWKHYCKYHDHPVEFEEFITIVEGYRKNPPGGWFYTQRMREFIEQAPEDTHLISTENIDELAKMLELEPFPKLHATEHDDYRTYYNPQLYRRVFNLA